MRPLNSCFSLSTLFILFISMMTVESVWTLNMFYSNDTLCANPITSYLVTETTSCTPNLACSSLGGMGGQKTQCRATFDDNQLTYTSFFRVWNSDASCGGTEDYLVAAEPGKCSGVTTTYTYLLDCDASKVYACASSQYTCASCTPFDAARNNSCTVTPAGFPFAAYKWLCRAYTTTGTGTTTTTSTTTPSVSTLLMPTFFILFALFSLLTLL